LINFVDATDGVTYKRNGHQTNLSISFKRSKTCLATANLEQAKGTQPHSQSINCLLPASQVSTQETPISGRYALITSATYWQTWGAALLLGDCQTAEHSAAATADKDYRDVPEQIFSAVQIFEISNRIVTPVSSIQHNYSKFSNTYRHQFLSYLTEW